MAGPGGPSEAFQVEVGPDFDLEEDGTGVKFEVVEEGKTYRKATTKFVLAGNRFFCTYWFPKDDGNSAKVAPKALVFVAHGVTGYLNLMYEEVAQMLASGGILVFGHDHVGHGRTTGSNLPCYIDKFDEYTRPVVAHVRAVQQWDGHQDLPTFLLGHSLGGLISLAVFLIEEQQSLFKVCSNLFFFKFKTKFGQEIFFSAIKLARIYDGRILYFILSCLVLSFKGFVGVNPLILPNPETSTPLKAFLANVLGGLWPSLTFEGGERNMTTRDKTVIDRLEADPLCYRGGIPVGTLSAMSSVIGEVGLKMPNLTLPTIIFQGMSDQLVDPSGARKLIDTISSEDKEIHEYPGAFHNVMVELQDVKKHCLENIESWIHRHIPE